MNLKKIFASATLSLGLVSAAPAAFVINEIDSDTPGTDAAEFIELKGNPNESAAGLIVVTFNGRNVGAAETPKVFKVIDIGHLTADENGFILIGGTNIPGADIYPPEPLLQNGPDAVAIYQAPASAFENEPPPTSVGLVDVLVYKAGANQIDKDWSGFGTTTTYNEAEYGNITLMSLSRVPGGAGTFSPSRPTPDQENVIASYTISTPSFVRMNQQSALQPTTQTITLRNTNALPLTVSSLQLDPSSAPQFSVVSGPTLPVTLAYNLTTTMVVQFLETDVSTNKTYSGTVNYVTDNPNTPTGSVQFGTELVRGTAAPVGAVKINEVCFNPGSIDHNGDGSTASQGDEYVELFNMTGNPILIEGWDQRCTDFDAPTFHSFVFPAGATIPANGFVTVFTSGNPTGFTPGTTFTYGPARIRNTGAYVGISDGSKLVDGVAYLGAIDEPDADGYTNTTAAAGLAAGGSFGPRPDGTGNFMAFTPGDAINPTTPNISNGISSVVSEWSLF